MAKVAFVVSNKDSFKSVVNVFKDTRRNSPTEGEDISLTYVYNSDSLSDKGYAKCVPASTPYAYAENGELIPASNVSLMYADDEEHLIELISIKTNKQKA